MSGKENNQPQFNNDYKLKISRRDMLLETGHFMQALALGLTFRSAVGLGKTGQDFVQMADEINNSHPKPYKPEEIAFAHGTIAVHESMPEIQEDESLRKAREIVFSEDKFRREILEMGRKKYGVQTLRSLAIGLIGLLMHLQASTWLNESEDE